MSYVESKKSPCRRVEFKKQLCRLVEFIGLDPLHCLVPVLMAPFSVIGALDGLSPCRLSILRNANVACLCRLFIAMSHVEFKK